MAELIFKDEVYAIVGAAMEVYNTLGPGFAEPVYQEALALEMAWRKIPIKEQPAVTVKYKGFALNKTYIPDFSAYDKILIEIKALDQITTREQAQLLNYLKATEKPLGLLINFGAADELEWKRMAATDYLLRVKRQQNKFAKISED